MKKIGPQEFYDILKEKSDASGVDYFDVLGELVRDGNFDYSSAVSNITTLLNCCLILLENEAEVDKSVIISLANIAYIQEKIINAAN